MTTLATSTGIQGHEVVSSKEWITSRKELLRKEKEFTRLRDELSQQRRELPWEKVEKEYVFDGPNGKVTLADLFGGKSQLIIYHFRFGPGWEAGCPSCSYLADHFDGSLVHLANRDVTLAVISRAPMPQIDAFKKRMGWQFRWVSSFANDFNRDYHVSFTKEEAKGKVSYNYEMTEFPSEEAPGASVFYKNDAGEIFHTYSAYARGLDILVGAYNFLDLAPKGRDEDGLAFSMAWVRHHDRYAEGYFVDPKALYVEPKSAGSSCCSEHKS
ncbi:MAG: thioredoxin family protein [Candidatus Sulfotelmatobacter sp.]